MAGTVTKDFRQMLKRLEREGIVVGLRHGSRHPVVLLRGGVTYSCACTPSDWRSLKNTEADIRRLLTRREDPGYTSSTLKRNVQPKDPR